MMEGKRRRIPAFLLPAVLALLAAALLLLRPWRDRAGGGTASWTETAGDRLRAVHGAVKRREIRMTQVGKTFTLGLYEQDNSKKNGPEPIRWIVLAREEDRVLAISKYVLDCRLYDGEYAPVTWETCDLRAWLNGEFLETAFSRAEQGLIPLARTPADPNPDYPVDPGEDTEDRVFLLSILEADRYFHPDKTPPPKAGDRAASDRYYRTYSTLLCMPTAYAVARGCVPQVENGASSWWFRSPGLSAASAAFANRLGRLSTDGILVNVANGTHSPGVRPALWIDLGSENDAQGG